jgi:hypothetical protein
MIKFPLVSVTTEDQALPEPESPVISFTRKSGMTKLRVVASSVEFKRWFDFVKRISASSHIEHDS